MRDFAADMMQDMSFRNPMGGMSANPAHQPAQITEEATIQSRESTTRKCECIGMVVRDQWIRVLKECDEYEPVVHPEVRSKVHFKHLWE